MQCPRCQHENPDNARFCGDCGAALEARACGACGAPVASGQKFCRFCGTPLDSLSASTRRPLPTSHDGERRQITVMFCDLVGSTALSAAMDPEDLRDVIGVYHACAAEIVARYEGFVAQYLGDGVLVYFGYPQAHEDDAERAVRAGLALVEAVGRLGVASERLQVRIGIATGLVIVGELIGSGEAKEPGAIGETPNLAARLQQMAKPNAVVIASSTRRLLGGLFDCQDLGTIEVKGFAEPMSVCQVLRPSAVESRFEALHAEQTPLVGREEEIELLLRRWRQAKDGEGQVVMLSGEPGIGKSRISAELLAELSNEHHIRLRYFCSPHAASSPLHPFASQLERAAGFAPGDSPNTKLGKLEALLTLSSKDLAEDVPVVAEVLSIPTEERYPPLNLTPPQKKERTLTALLVHLERLAGRQSVLTVFEDAHWIDPTSMELLERIVERVESLSVLLVITFRPEWEPPWVGLAHVTLHPLNRLNRREGAAMIEQLTGGKPLPREVADQIIVRTDGVPLFVEELTKTVLESGRLHDRDGQYVVAGPLPSLAIPTSLHASLMARLDRLAAAKEIAQVGAALGRDFSYELLHAVTPWEERALVGALDQLLKAGLVHGRGSPPDAVYTFKHALVQDAAYSTLLRRARQHLHARIAQVLEERLPDRAARQPEVLAHHFTEGQQLDRATGYWLKAGKQAAERSANVEAISHLSRGLEGLKTLPEGPERDQQELALQIAIGTPLIAVHGYHAPRTGAAYSRARVLCERLEEAEALLATLSGEFTYHFVRGDYGMMRQLAEDATHTSAHMADEALRLAAHRLSAITAMHFGAFPEARSEFETILSVYDPSRHRPPPVHYVHDPKVSALTYLALILWMLGYPEQARRSSIAAFQYARVLNQANLTAHVSAYAGAGLDELLGDTAAVRKHADAIIDLADQHSLHYWRLTGLILRGWVMAQEGAADRGLSLMRQSLTSRRGLGVGWYQIRYLCMLATTELQCGAAEAGLRIIAEAQDLVARNDEHLWEAELKRVEGELRRVQGVSGANIAVCFERALAMARGQSAKSIELRAASSLARLWRDQGKRSEARDLLESVYSRFTEGFDTADLKAAKALLNELSL
jgi:predicted ATPase/class 3 adenylate cyclase